MKRRNLAILCALCLMAVSMLAACGGTTPPVSTTAPVQSTEPAATTEATPEQTPEATEAEEAPQEAAEDEEEAALPAEILESLNTLLNEEEGQAERAFVEMRTEEIDGASYLVFAAASKEDESAITGWYAYDEAAKTLYAYDEAANTLGEVAVTIED